MPRSPTETQSVAFVSWLNGTFVNSRVKFLISRSSIWWFNMHVRPAKETILVHLPGVWPCVITGSVCQAVTFLRLYLFYFFPPVYVCGLTLLLLCLCLPAACLVACLHGPWAVPGSVAVPPATRWNDFIFISYSFLSATTFKSYNTSDATRDQWVLK